MRHKRKKKNSVKTLICQERKQSTQPDTDMVQMLSFSDREFKITVINDKGFSGKWVTEQHTQTLKIIEKNQIEGVRNENTETDMKCAFY